MAVKTDTWLTSLYVTVAIYNFASPTYAQVCGVTFTQRSGSIQFQSNHYDQVDCDYLIQQPEGFRITLTFLDFKRTEDMECHLDKIQIYDGPSSSSPKFGDPVCKTSSLPVLRSTYNSMRIHFTANDTLPFSEVSYMAETGETRDSQPLCGLLPDQLSLELMLVTHYNKDTLYRFDLDTFSYTYITVQTPDNEMPRSIAYDPVEMRVYWSAVHWNQVKDSELFSSYLNGTENRRIGNLFHDSFIDGIAVDWLSRVMVYVESQQHVIAMMTINSLHHRVLIHDDLREPRKITLDILNGVMFWADWNDNRRTIERANYDGSNRSIVATTTARPCSLAIDMKNGHLYWTQLGLAQVEKSDLDGRNRETVFNLKGFKFFGIALHRNEIFLTDWTLSAYNTNQSHLQRISSSGKNEGRVYSTETRLSDIVIYSSSDHVPGPNGCGNDNGGCSHICIPCAGKTRKCLCPDELHLSEDNKTCYSGELPHVPPATSTSSMTLSPLIAVIHGPSTFDTDGTRAINLTCDLEGEHEPVDYTWNVPCESRQGGLCTFTPKPPDDNHKNVTCTVRNARGQSTEVTFVLTFDYPPTSPPEIRGYKLGDLLHIGEKLNMSCFVTGGKPLVLAVNFFCEGHPDSTDIVGKNDVQSVISIKSLALTDDRDRCSCSALWKNGDLYNTTVITTLSINDTAVNSESMITSSTENFTTIGVAVGGGVLAILVVISIIIIITWKHFTGVDETSRLEALTQTTSASRDAKENEDSTALAEERHDVDGNIDDNNRHSADNMDQSKHAEYLQPTDIVMESTRVCIEDEESSTNDDYLHDGRTSALYSFHPVNDENDTTYLRSTQQTSAVSSKRISSENEDISCDDCTVCFVNTSLDSPYHSCEDMESHSVSPTFTKLAF